MIISEIPLAAESQILRVTIGNIAYNLSVLWRGIGFYLDISDENNVLIASGLAMVPGADLLGQLAHLGIAGNWVILSDIDPSVIPMFDTLGITSHLCVIT